MAAPTTNNTMPRIFVSHNHQDNTYCRAFVTAMRQEVGSDAAVWYDEHNLGWGKLRREIERELALRQHFIAIFSPTAVDSEWVNDEIDAAVDLLHDGSMLTVQFVIALPCKVPLLLRNYKRVVAPDGQPYPAAEAAHRALAVIHSVTGKTGAAPAPSAAVPVQQTPPYPFSPPPPTIAPDHFPQRLASLGFKGHTVKVNGKAEQYIVPPLCEVPAGQCLMGSDPKRDQVAAKASWAEREKPQHSITLPAYQMARYPVAVAEYACFVRGGYQPPQEDSWRHVTWEQQLQHLDHPIVNISWHDAVAYAKWLAERTGQSWRLPTEAEWEKAARGSDGRIYPWGDSFDTTRCNTNESGIGTTTPVGSYPSGASRFDVQDMAGNVWEWTSTAYKQYPYTIADGREDVNSTENRVLRGGSWLDGSSGARAAFRINALPDGFNGSIGFRLVVASPIL